jgi:hypothetical protein
MSGLYALKPWFTSRLTPIVNVAARRVSPDVFTVAGVVVAGAAAVAIALGCWPLAVLFLVLRLVGANLDGAVARAAGGSGRGRATAQRGPAGQDRTVPLHGAGYCISGDPAGDPGAAGERFAALHRAAAAGRASRLVAQRQDEPQRVDEVTQIGVVRQPLTGVAA